MKGLERNHSLWIVTDDSDLADRVRGLLGINLGDVHVIDHELAGGRSFWRNLPDPPSLVLLDPVRDLDWAVGVIASVKRSQPHCPIVVLSQEANHEFGTKVVSAGISYFLPRSFEGQELCNVVDSLVNPHKQTKH